MRISVALPTSIIVKESSLLSKTLRVYQLVRYSSIFGVSELIFYNDGYVTEKQHDEALAFTEKIWRYLVTPPYLRRKLIPIDSDLRYVGVLPPLRLEVFDVERRPVEGELRLGYLYRSRGKTLVDIGDDKPYRVEGGTCRGDIVLVEVVDTTTRRAVCVDKQVYMGPILGSENDLMELTASYRRKKYLVIATSRYGVTPTISEITRKLSLKKKILILFGGPRHGLYEIAEKKGFKLEDMVDAVWNMVPEQKVKTIRSEEALIITLAIINMFLRRH